MANNEYNIMLSTFFFVVYSVCELVSYIPQIVKLIKTKKADDISAGSWAIWSTSSCAYLGYVALTSPQNIGLIVLCIVDVTFVFTTFCLTKYYQLFGSK